VQPLRKKAVLKGKIKLNKINGKFNDIHTGDEKYE
jgi:hypothetical protein